MEQIEKQLLTSLPLTLRWLQYILYGGLLLHFGRDIYEGSILHKGSNCCAGCP